MTADEADAIRFRESMGFTTDLTVVRAAAADAIHNPPELGGSPLTKAETAEVKRRMMIQWASVPALAYATAQRDFAGSFIDQPAGGVPVFLFTGGLDSHQERIAAALTEPIEFRVEHAPRSLEDLLGQQAEILGLRDRLLAADTDVVETAILPDQNAVLVGIRGFTESRAAEVTEVAGQGLVFEEAKPAHADCANGNNCRPIKGGIAIHKSTGAWPCTSGFVVKDGSALRLLTAGHCLDKAGGPGTDFYHNGVKFGDALNDTWQYPNYTRTADVGLIDIDATELAQMTSDNLMHRGAGYVYSVVGQVQGALVSQGQLVYRYGRTSGTDNGLVNGLYASRQSCVPVVPIECMTVTKTIRVDFDSTGGDSGGPLFYYVLIGGVTRVIAMGTHVHSEADDPNDPDVFGWYSPVDVGAAQYDSNWGPGHLYTLCTSASC